MGRNMGRDLEAGDMARVLNRLSDVAVRAKKGPGYCADGGNLYLRVAPGGTKGWIFRFCIGGRTRDAGLGSYPTVSLVKAREEAERCRRLLAEGIDPIHAREKQRQAARIRNAKAKTFAECAREFIAGRERLARGAIHETVALPASSEQEAREQGLMKLRFRQYTDPKRPSR
jgi:hypothetical protein